MFENAGQGIVKGLAVTIKYFFKRPVTVQYPEQRLNPSRRTRGNELIWSRERCTGCATCAKACHIGAIKIVTSPNAVNNRYEVETYRVDTGYCIHCGLCVEACPFDALYMGSGYEKATYRREDLVQQKEVMEEKPGRITSAYFHPERADRLPAQTLLVEKISEEKMNALAVAFWVFAIAAVVGGLGVVLLKNVFRAALSLVLCLLAVAGLYVTLSADFLAAAQILVYVGAISVLIILAIMMTHDIKTGSPANRFQVPALLVCVVFFGLVVYAVSNTPWRIANTAPVFPTTAALAGQLFGPKGFILPVEIGAVVLLAAVIGAIVLAREK